MPTRKHKRPQGASADLPMHVASSTVAGDTKAVAAWLDAGGDVNAARDSPGGDVQRVTCLIVASMQGHEKMVDLLITRGARVDHQSSDGATPLLCAAEHGRGNIVKKLLEAGANPKLKHRNGMTALQLADAQGRTRIVRLLRRSLPRAFDPDAALLSKAVADAWSPSATAALITVALVYFIAFYVLNIHGDS